MIVYTSITYPSGASQGMIVDWSDREQVVIFLQAAEKALKRGAEIVTREYPIKKEAS